MTDLSLEIDTKQINSLIDRAIKIGKTGPLMDNLGRAMVSDIDMNFRRSQGPDGTPWDSLKHRDGQPLRDTGRLQRSISYKASEDETEVGTNLKYAATHQFGATIKPKKGKFLVFPIRGAGGQARYVFARQVIIPARPFIGLETRQVSKINRIIDQWAEEVLSDQ